MASMDNIYSLVDSLEKDKYDYVVIALAHGKEKSKADVFFHIYNKKKVDSMSFILSNVIEQIQNIKNSKGSQGSKD